MRQRGNFDDRYLIVRVVVNDEAQAETCSCATGVKECMLSKLSHVILVGASRAGSGGKERRQRGQPSILEWMTGW
jgi:hypothetical protein